MIKAFYKYHNLSKLTLLIAKNKTKIIFKLLLSNKIKKFKATMISLIAKSKSKNM